MNDRPEQTPVHLPERISSIKMGKDGQPESLPAPLAPEVPMDDKRALFPGVGQNLSDQIRAATHAGNFDGVTIAGGHQPTVHAPTPASPPSGGTSGSPPSVSGVIDGGAPHKSGSSKPVVEFLNPAKVGVYHDLEDPLKVDGVEYRKAFIKSPEGARYGMFQQLAAESGNDQFKLFTAIIWLVSNLPLEVIENLSIDDRDDLMRIGSPFLSRRLRRSLRPYLLALEAMDEVGKEPAPISSTTEESAE